MMLLLKGGFLIIVEKAIILLNERFKEVKRIKTEILVANILGIIGKTIVI